VMLLYGLLYESKCVRLTYWLVVSLVDTFIDGPIPKFLYTSFITLILDSSSYRC